MGLQEFVKTFTGKLVFLVVGLFLCLSSSVIVLSLLNWIGVALSLGSFFLGFSMIYYTIMNNRKS
ncbi:hypothetical protein FJY84_09115 [Candidatus Bathyarchaeota archaeon]|nr:hypothetical protein [Candidatus Bathyarchaeota archaeon]